MEGGDDAFFHGRKTAVEVGSLPYIDSEYAMEGEDLQEPGWIKEGPGTLVSRRPFGYFWGEPKVTQPLEAWTKVLAEKIAAWFNETWKLNVGL